MNFIQDLKTVIKESLRLYRRLRARRQRIQQIQLPF